MGKKQIRIHTSWFIERIDSIDQYERFINKNEKRTNF